MKPHLESGVEAWNPHQLEDVRKIENVQRRFTRLIPNLKAAHMKQDCKYYT